MIAIKRVEGVFVDAIYEYKKLAFRSIENNWNRILRRNKCDLFTFAYCTNCIYCLQNKILKKITTSSNIPSIPAIFYYWINNLSKIQQMYNIRNENKKAASNYHIIFDKVFQFLINNSMESLKSYSESNSKNYFFLEKTVFYIFYQWNKNI